MPSPPQRVCELLFPLLRRGGRVVNVSSGAGYPGFLRTGLPGLVPPGHAAHAEQIIAAVTSPELSLAALEDMVRGYQQLADAGPDKVVALLPKIFSRLKNICEVEEHGWMRNPYCASKLFFCALSRLQQKTFSIEEDIAVNHVHPGFVGTELGLGWTPPEMHQFAITAEK